MGAAMAMGNRAVLVASEPFPLAAMELVQVLETSDVPGGVANLLVGPVAELAKPLIGEVVAALTLKGEGLGHHCN